MKPPNSVLILKYYSLTPGIDKRSVVSSLTNRIFKSCTNWSRFHTSFRIDKQILAGNQYPSSFHEKVICEPLKDGLETNEHMINYAVVTVQPEKIIVSHI